MATSVEFFEFAEMWNFPPPVFKNNFIVYYAKRIYDAQPRGSDNINQDKVWIAELIGKSMCLGLASLALRSAIAKFDFA